MLTPEQETWLAHLSTVNTIKIVPFDPTAEEKFELIKQKIQNTLGTEITVEHHGATSLKISGQDEIDIYLPASVSKFELLTNQLKTIFGEPRSLYPNERIRFTTEVAGKHVDIFLINQDCDGWKNGLIFEKYLRTHPEALQVYQQLKESGDGLSVQAYYRNKIEFINDILSRQ